MSIPFDSRLMSTRHGPMWGLSRDAYITPSLERYGEYCPGEGELFGQIVRSGMTVIEAGANIGAHTVMLARRCSPGLLYAFEPQQRVFQLLCANLVINQISNVRAYPEGAGAAAGTAFTPPIDYGSDANFGNISLSQDSAGNGGQMTRVTPIDALGLAACDFIKIDVEGWELAVLDGARQTIARCRPLIHVENDRADHQAALIGLLDELGYVQYWHLATLFSANNFNGAAENIFGGATSLSLFCVPKESALVVDGFERIDPSNWRSPIKPI